jgi:hypothetical protein
MIPDKRFKRRGSRLAICGTYRTASLHSYLV